MATSIYEFRLEFYADETNYPTVKSDVLASLETLKDNNKIMRVNGNIDEITMPSSVYKFTITFETDESNRDYVKNQVVTKLSTLKTEAQIFDVSGIIRERLEYSVENLTF